MDAFTTADSAYCSYQNTPTPGCPCDPRDYHETGIVGYDYTYKWDPNYRYLFSSENVDRISAAITTALEGVDPQNRRIVVNRDRIIEVLSTVFWNSRRQKVGDIYSRYIVPNCTGRNDTYTMNMETINIIVRAIRDECQTIESNKKLTVWTTLLGDFNNQGLRSHPPLKIRKKFPQRMMFNMNY